MRLFSPASLHSFSYRFAVIVGGVALAVACGGSVSGGTGGTGATGTGANGSGATGTGATGTGATGNGGAGGSNCDNVACTTQDCLPGETPVFHDGDCCPTCEPLACPTIPCAMVDCAPGYMPVTLPGDCCPTCQPTDCSNVMCPAIGCGPGSVPVTYPGECCPTCEPNCNAVDCAFPNCPAGFVAQTLPGECCPTCVPADDQLCQAGRNNFESTLLNNLGDQIRECKVDSDCTVIDITSRCGTTCMQPFNVAYVPDVVDFAKLYGEDNCSTCTDTPVGCPEPLYMPFCDISAGIGQCVVAIPL